MLIMIFIHSSGHTGTRWISRNLNSSNKIISVHGDQLSKVFHKKYLKYEVLDEIFGKTTRNKKSQLVFVHQPFHFNINEYNKLKNDHKFIFISRNPKKRINTIIAHFLLNYLFSNRAGYFARHQKSLINIKIDLRVIFKLIEKDINNLFNICLKKNYLYKFYYLTKSLQYSFINTFFKRKKSSINNDFILKNRTFLALIIINLFRFGVQTSLANDKLIIKYKLKYFCLEKITNSKKEFVKFAKCIDPEYNESTIKDDLFLNKIGLKNIDNKGNKFWPKTFKKTFQSHLNKKLKNFYLKNNL